MVDLFTRKAYKNMKRRSLETLVQHNDRFEGTYRACKENKEGIDAAAKEQTMEVQHEVRYL